MESIKLENAHSYRGQGEWIDRWHSALGNPYKLASETTEARAEVVSEYAKWLDAALRSKGYPRSEFDRLVRKYIEEQRLTLICWCAPKLCHGEVIRNRINQEVNRWKAVWLMRRMAGLAPGRSWSIWLQGQFWLGAIGAKNEATAIAKAERLWPKFIGRICVKEIHSSNSFLPK